MIGGGADYHADFLQIRVPHAVATVTSSNPDAIKEHLMHTSYRVAALLALAAAATTAHATTGGEPMEECVDLSASHAVHRSGSQYLLVADSEAHYRVEMVDSCGTLPLASRFAISTNGQAGRLCPVGTRVKTNLDSCRVRAVERIDSDTYARLRRKR